VQTTTRRRLVAAGGVTAGATLALTGAAQAAPLTYTVGTNADSSSGGACTTPTNSDCSLREAVSLSNTNIDPDTIVFNSNLTGSTITLTTGALLVTDGVAITGPGSAQLTVTAGGNSQIFGINTIPDDAVSISGVTLTDGDAGTSSGGAISNEDATLTVSSAAVSDSHADLNGEAGGGIYNTVGSLIVDGSSVSGNSGYYGGGIGSANGAVTITNSTVSGNYASTYGGGVWTGRADLTVQGSTISGNDASEDGGGIYSSFATTGGNGDPVTLENSTVTDNHAVTDDGGGVWVCCGDPGDTFTVVDSTITGNTAATKTGGLQAYLENGNPVLRNSIVSGNSSGTPPVIDDLYAETGHLWAASFSLVGIASTYLTDAVPGSNLTGVDPQLGPLADNGGPTFTQLPGDTSPVIDCGSDATNPFDQRGVGFPRVVDQLNRTNSTAVGANGADMGAVELAANPAIAGACANNAPPAPPPPAAPTPTPVQNPTGQRAAAKRHCKKKFRHNKPKLKKCLKRARKLPV
jgi:hypothetical protein